MAKSDKESNRKVTKERVYFNKQRVLAEIKQLDYMSQSKRGNYNLTDLARDLHISPTTIKHIWSRGLDLNDAENLLKLFDDDVRMEYLEGRDDFRTEKELWDHVYAQTEKNISEGFTNALKHYNSLRGLKIEPADNVKSSTGKVSRGYKITYWDKTTEKKCSIYKTDIELMDFFNKMDDTIKNLFENFIL